MRFKEEEMKEVCMWSDVEESRHRIRDSTPQSTHYQYVKH